jgi:UDP-glucose 4-epimerase
MDDAIYKKALVTGGCGFIGTNLVGRLVEDGMAVNVLDVAATEGLTDARGVRFYHGDMGSSDALLNAVDGVDVVFHLAWSTIPKTSNEDPIFDVNSNVAGTLKLLQACVSKGVKKVCFISSGGTVYGVPKSAPLDEDSPTEPINSYGITKLCVEKYLMLFNRLHGLDYVVLRPSNPYGPYQNPLGQVGTVAVFMYRAMTGLPISIWGDGRVVRDFVFIGDLVEAMVRASRAGDTEHKVFNVGSGEGIAVIELLDRVRAVVGREPEVIFEERRSFDTPVNVLDNGRARAELGWSPGTGLTEGLEKTFRWMREWLVSTGRLPEGR